MLQAYRQHVAERATLGIPPLPLTAQQTAELIELINAPQILQSPVEEAFLLDLITHRVPPGVDDAAKVKASFLSAVAHGDLAVALISKAKATFNQAYKPQHLEITWMLILITAPIVATMVPRLRLTM